MSSIAIVDDRPQMRESCARLIRSLLRRRLDVLEVEPLEHSDDYPSWLVENDISLLLIDERLHEQSGRRGHVQYSGHDVVDCVRSTNPTFPIFMLTSFAEDQALQDRIGSVEYIIDRTKFNTPRGDEAKTQTERMFRAATRYSQKRNDALAELGRISQKIAEGTATRKMEKRLIELQEELCLRLPGIAITSRTDWLNEAQSSISEIQKLQASLDKHLKKNK